MADLIYNTKELSDVKATYDECLVDMVNLRSEMNKMVEDLKEGWKSGGSEEFFKKYNDEWLQGFSQYIDVIRHMSVLLNGAVESYGAVTEKAEKLSLDIDSLCESDS